MGYFDSFGFSLGLMPALRSWTNLFRVSNQNGAPSEIARTVKNQPKSVNRIFKGWDNSSKVGQGALFQPRGSSTFFEIASDTSAAAPVNVVALDSPCTFPAIAASFTTPLALATIPAR